MYVIIFVIAISSDTCINLFRAWADLDAEYAVFSYNNPHCFIIWTIKIFSWITISDNLFLLRSCLLLRVLLISHSSIEPAVRSSEIADFHHNI
jgi:hypothetical protein